MVLSSTITYTSLNFDSPRQRCATMLCYSCSNSTDILHWDALSYWWRFIMPPENGKYADFHETNFVSSITNY